MKRRQFLKSGIYSSFVFATAPALVASCKKDDEKEETSGIPNTGIQIDLSTATYTSLNTAGNYVYYQNIIIFNTGTSFLALSRVCTHEGCPVTYDHGAGNIPCGCHGSKFTTTGSVINGPAAVALKSYSVTKNGNILTIK